ncbi:MAG TPA: zf-HC2 domain-containing protein [Pyrinomonadaceae bacterium]|nr:zf-HC2 domain-containing protein [Pyrinomonadaceae bacterium]
MNCAECQENISFYLDGELDDLMSSTVRTHLTVCPECAKLFEDFASILDSCHTVPPQEIVPPNSQALWCRISNTIESEVKPPATPAPVQKRGWFGRSFTFSQAGVAVACVALISSLLTVVGIRNYFEPSGQDFTSRSAASQTTFEKVLAKVGLADTPQQARERRLKEQQAAIDYWTQRVQARRAQWDNRVRDAFDRNLHEIDTSVHEYTEILDKNPDDELSGEMLDAVLDDKMNLLRSFSEL